MKKIIVAAGAVLIFLSTAYYLWAPSLLTRLITHYPPFTHERVLASEELREKYGIGEHRSPDDYGFPQSEEVSIYSLHDSLRLSAWYLPLAPASRSIVLVHGRTSNRLKPMKYLQLFRDTGLDTLYNVLIPDLRNSGKSETGKTYMGYKFAEDLLACLKYLKEKRQQDTVVIYAFSMGAMATLAMTGRPDLQDELQATGIHIEKVIFDSPLSNVKMTVKKTADSWKVPESIFERSFALFSEATSGFVGKMQMHTLISDFKAPILVLQGRQDKTTPVAILEHELEQIQADHLRIHFFENGEHVRLYQSDEYHREYTEIVDTFLRGRQ